MYLHCLKMQPATSALWVLEQNLNLCLALHVPLHLGDVGQWLIEIPERLTARTDTHGSLNAPIASKSCRPERTYSSVHSITLNVKWPQRLTNHTTCWPDYGIWTFFSFTYHVLSTPKLYNFFCEKQTKMEVRISQTGKGNKYKKEICINKKESYQYVW